MASFSVSLTVKDGFAAMDFYKEAFGAEIVYQIGTFRRRSSVNA